MSKITSLTDRLEHDNAPICPSVVTRRTAKSILAAVAAYIECLPLDHPESPALEDFYQDLQIKAVDFGKSCATEGVEL